MRYPNTDAEKIDVLCDFYDMLLRFLQSRIYNLYYAKFLVNLKNENPDEISFQHATCIESLKKFHDLFKAKDYDLLDSAYEYLINDLCKYEYSSNVKFLFTKWKSFKLFYKL